MRSILFKSLLVFLFVATVASAGPLCSTLTGTSLDNFIGLGSGCSIGSLQFSGFSYNYTAVSPTGPLYEGVPQPATSVIVTVDDINKSLRFDANWVAGQTQTSSFSLSFTVAAPTSAISSLKSDFTYVSSGPDNGGPLYTLVANCAGGTCGSSTDFTDVTLPITPTSSTLTITDTVTMNANGIDAFSDNNFHLSIIKDQFALTSPPDQVPEPVTYALTGFGLVAVACYVRRKRK